MCLTRSTCRSQEIRKGSLRKDLIGGGQVECESVVIMSVERFKQV